MKTVGRLMLVRPVVITNMDLLSDSKQLEQ